MKKGFAFFLAAVMAAGMIGCSSGNGKAAPASQAPAASTKAESAEASKAPETPAAAAWAPKSEIEFVVPSSAGGGSDTNARTIADIAFTSSFSPKNFKVNNMPGGSGAVAFSYMASKKGNDEIIMVLHNGQVMSTLINKSPVVAADLTFLPVVAFDNLTLCIHKDGKYKSIEEMVAAAKANPGQVKIGGSQRGNSDHLSYELIKKYLGIDVAYVQFNSSGETMSAVLGGHVDFGIFNPSECIGQIEAKEVIPVATFAEKALDGAFEGVKTFKDLGYPEVVVTEVRALSGTPGMSAEAIAFYDEMIKKVTESEKWKKEYIEKNYLTPVYMNSADAKTFFEKETEKYISVFKEVGVME
ncbi:tripartite tricarboxylate transporter substrate binding protein [Oscillospiraceae bacterium PP1C4]